MNLVEASTRSKFDYWPETLELLPEALDLARHMRRFAKHYDDREYGAVILGVTPENKIEPFFGANRNEMPGQNPTRQCAEKAALIEAEVAKIIYIPAVVVSGPVQPDTHSGKKLETTTPCGTCRHDLPASGLADNNTLILSYHPEEPIVEVNTLQETKDIHDGVLPVEASNVFRGEELAAMCWAPERYSSMRQMYAPSPFLARLALADRQVLTTAA